MGTIKTADSWWEPTVAQVQAAKAQGYGGWLGYRASGSNENIYHSWSPATFAMLQAQGMVTAAYYSGLEDPAWVKADAAAVGIKAILDCESGIRGDGDWTDPWLAASGAALYGSALVMDAHYSHGHPGYVLAGYPGGVQSATWAPGVPVPPQPKGWQWADPSIEPVSFGAVDTSNFDAQFFMQREEEMLLTFVAKVVAGTYAGQEATFVSNGMRFRWVQNPSQLADVLNTGESFNGGVPVKQWGGPVADVGAFGNPDDPVTASMLGLPFGTTGASGLTADQAAALDAMAAAVSRIEAALKGA